MVSLSWRGWETVSELPKTLTRTYYTCGYGHNIRPCFLKALKEITILILLKPRKLTFPNRD